MSKQVPESNDARETKRAQFAEPEKTGSKSTLILVAVLVAAIAVVAYVVLGSSADKPTVIADPAPAQSGKAAEPDKPAATSELRVPLADVAGGRAKFFDYKLANNEQVRFFVVKSSAGDYRAALDACEVCAHAKQGYRQEGDDMVCNNCGKKFATALIGKIQGGCHPVGLTATADGDSLVIKRSELESGKKYF
ncbi:MAG TPA: DUF2318 domain-containing protein [Blastocatellia bacterium]|nr:DUF2318 domain-containing protein [Blastocatellia bacterium]